MKDLFKFPCDFIAGAASIEQIPNNIYMPEVAFVGRSNVGKSSLLNALVGQRNCARVSKQPGRTQQINFFSIKDRISLTDLPGYGYAAVSKKTRKLWNQLIFDYLMGRQNLRRIFLLIDSRHGIKDNDEQAMNILDESAVTYQIILTKIDKSPKYEKIKETILTNTFKNHIAIYPEIICTSSEKNIGINQIRSEILSFL